MKRSKLLCVMTLAAHLALFGALTPATQAAWIASTVLFEDFEGAFPEDNGWLVGVGNPLRAPAYWEDVSDTVGTLPAHGGRWKGYCAGQGYRPPFAAPSYPNYMEASMSRTLNLAPYSVAPYASVQLSFWYHIPSIDAGEAACRVLLDGTELWRRDTATADWTQQTIDLTPYAGGSHVLKFLFTSGYNTVPKRGWFLDDISVFAVPQWANDNFDDCEAIAGASGQARGSNVGATTESPNEPNHHGVSALHSIWYCWQAPSSDPVTFDTLGSDFDTVLAVYTGITLNPEFRRYVDSNDDIAGYANRQSRVTFTPVAGVVYKIAVAGYGNTEFGRTVLNWSQAGSLPDLVSWAVGPHITYHTFESMGCDCIDAPSLPAIRRLLRFSTVTTNRGAGDLVLGNPKSSPLLAPPGPLCPEYSRLRGFAEYRLRNKATAAVVSWNTNAGLGLFDWIPASGRKYTLANQGIRAGSSDIQVASLFCQYLDITGVPPGTYSLEIEVNPRHLFAETDESNNLTAMDVTIPPECVGPEAPGNDNYASAYFITDPTPGGRHGQRTGWNWCGSRQSGEPLHGANASDRTVWFKWTATYSGNVIIATDNNFRTALAVYSGATFTGLSLVQRDSPGHGQAKVSFSAVSGTTYSIAVAGVNLSGLPGGTLGSITVSINPPPNNNFAECETITGSGGSTSGSTQGGFRQGGEPFHAGLLGYPSVWFCWTAPASGLVGFDTLGSGFDTLLAVYQGGSVNALGDPVASNDNAAPGVTTSRTCFYAVKGQTYHVAVDGFLGDHGNYTLNWEMKNRLFLERGIFGGGGFRISVLSVPGVIYDVETSSDMAHWTSIGRVTGTGDLVSVSCGQCGGSSARFFRARLILNL